MGMLQHYLCGNFRYVTEASFHLFSNITFQNTLAYCPFIMNRNDFVKK